MPAQLSDGGRHTLSRGCWDMHIGIALPARADECHFDSFASLTGPRRRSFQFSRAALHRALPGWPTARIAYCRGSLPCWLSAQVANRPLRGVGVSIVELDQGGSDLMLVENFR